MVLATLSEDGHASPPESSEAAASHNLTDLERAKIKVKKSFANTKLGIGEKERLLPQFQHSELKIGKVLGTGGFGTVSEILGITIKKDAKHSSFSFRSWANINPAAGSQSDRDGQGGQEAEEEAWVPEFDPDFDESAFQSKKFISDYVVGKGRAARYAIKVISPHVKKDPKKFIRAAMDMATETHFLSVLDHPHIIKMRAVGEGDMFDKDYFFVLDRLYDTLDEQIDTWRAKTERTHTCIGRLRGGKKKKIKIFSDRLNMLRDLASALEHLHGLNIIYRDIKPENIGFDIKGVVKLFDFGLAKELHPENKLANGTFRLTGLTGSMRYMAPEVANRRPYNLSADVYSFGIMLWEVVAMDVPFDCYSPSMIKEMVANFGNRPDVNESWPEGLQVLMKSCWDAKFANRPSVSAIIPALETEITKLQPPTSNK